MKTPRSRKDRWPRKVTCGRVCVSVYRRTMPNGEPGFMVANYAGGRRRFDSYPQEGDALEAANRLARQLSERDVLTASMTRAQAVEYASAIQALKPLNLGLPSAVTTLVEAVKLVGDLPAVVAAAKFYATRHNRTLPKPVHAVVAELLQVKEARGASPRYLEDLRARLNRFAVDCQRDTCNVTTSDIQAWLDGLKLSAQNYRNFRTVLNTLFEFAVARSYASDNPVERVERVKVRNGEIKIYTPAEIARLLAAASPDFRPCIALGAFGGLRSSEIERLGPGRRIVPIHDNLTEWLHPYAGQEGKVWTGSHEEFYEAQQATGAAARPPVRWKSNALRHSYASYRFAQTADAGRVAGELGNSAAVVHRHYRELVKPVDAERWFNVGPEAPANVVTLTADAKR